ncbi:MAG: signal peptide peptidase SppA [Candidatus Aminicenantes bacterium]|nr:signal peptide peptidase SppA [Candidatus Aminicenantes bacterium]
MKRGKYVLLIVLFFIVLIAAAFITLIYVEFAPKPPSVGVNSYLEIKLGGELAEWSQPDFLTSFFVGAQPQSLNDIWTNLRKAKVDHRIQGVLLRLNMLQCGWAKADEIRGAILDFRASGKKAFAFIEEAPEFNREYYLATACDKIVLHPLGWLGLTGIGGDVPFFKKGLEKLGIQAQFEHIGKFKTAYNQFTEEGFTPAHREMEESLLSDTFNHFVKTVAQARHKTEAEVKNLIDKAFFQGEQAKTAGLVDEVLYDDQLPDLFQAGGAKLVRVGSEDYLRVKPSSLGLETGRRVALIYAMGPILGGESLNYQMIGSQTLARWIRRARLDKSIAAVVMRVDSPGGSAVASDTIGREVELTKKVKPVVISMSDMAGSGGYWISMSAHKIFAQPQTLTGSIGVLSGKFNFAKLYEKLGISSEELKYGRQSNIFSTFHPLSKEEQALLQEQISWIYDKFLTKASEGRNLTKDKVNDIGQGRVWTGNQALAIGLVDELGGLTAAIEEAKRLAGIPAAENVQLDIRPRKTSWWGSLFGGSRDIRSIRLDPSLKKALDSLAVMQRERFLAIMPLWIPMN